MEETINEIMAYVKRKVSGYGHMDQAQIYEDLTGRMSDLNLDALKSEYLQENY